MNEISLPFETFGALCALDGPPLDRAADIETLRAKVRSLYDFLPRPMTVQVGSGTVIITCAGKTSEDKAEALRLFERAERRVRQGDFERAAALCRRALCCQPLFHAARRELARAYLETGNTESSTATLWQGVRVDPKDVWSLVTLAGLRLQGRLVDQAWSLARMALAVEPSNPRALDVLGQAWLAAGREAEALETFGQAILIDPELPQPRLGAAKALLAQGQPEASFKLLEGLIATASDNAAPVIGQARRLCVDVQAALMARNLDPAREAVEAFRVRIEARDGVPIDVRYGEEKLASAEVAWTSHRGYHLVRCCNSFPEPIQLHLLAHEFMHLQMESEAREAGKLHAFTMARDGAPALLGLFASQQHDLRRQGHDSAWIERHIEQAVALCRDLFVNVPLDMVVESRLHEQLPALRPAQFISMHRFMERSLTVDEYPLLRRILPRELLRAVTALTGAFRLFADDLHRGATDYTAPYRSNPVFDRSEELFRHWQSRSRHLGPGDHYGLAEDFAVMLGVPRVFEWRPVPVTLDADKARIRACAA